MFLKRRKLEFLNREFYFLWIALAFQAGFANAGGFLACARFVSHMTGFGTQVGIAISELDYFFALELASAPASFVLGAMFSGWAVDRPMLKRGQPRYFLVLWTIVGIFSAIAVSGMAGLFGEFGEPLRYGHDFLLLALLCFACGMQNACFASLTRGQIRTTHLTGLLTDLGTTSMRLLYLERGRREIPILARTNWVRFMTFCSFSTGSAISAVLFVELGHSAFSVLVVTSLGIVWTTIRKTRRRYGTLETNEQSPLPAAVKSGAR